MKLISQSIMLVDCLLWSDCPLCHAECHLIIPSATGRIGQDGLDSFWCRVLSQSSFAVSRSYKSDVCSFVAGHTLHNNAFRSVRDVTRGLVFVTSQWSFSSRVRSGVNCGARCIALSFYWRAVAFSLIYFLFLFCFLPPLLVISNIFPLCIFYCSLP